MLRPALLSPSNVLSLSLTRSPSRIFQWWLLSLSSLRKQRILVHTGQREGEGWRAGQRGRDPNLECGRPMSGKSNFARKGNQRKQYTCIGSSNIWFHTFSTPYGNKQCFIVVSPLSSTTLPETADRCFEWKSQILYATCPAPNNSQSLPLTDGNNGGFSSLRPTYFLQEFVETKR